MVDHAIETGTPTALVVDATLEPALDGASIADSTRTLEVDSVDVSTIAEHAAAGTVDCAVLTPTDPVDPGDVAPDLPVVYYDTDEGTDAGRVRDLAASDGVDYVPATPDHEHALLRDRVTDRVAAERVRADRDVRADAMDQAGIGITIADADHPDEALVYANLGFETVTGYTADEAIGRNCRFLQGEDTDPGQVATLREAIENDVSATVELRNYRADGTPIWNRVSVSPVYDEGRVTHYVGTQEDVTDLRNAQRARRRMVEITTDPDRDFEAKVDALLALGCERLDVDVGFLSAIDDDFEVLAADSNHPDLQIGEHAPLSQTYCRRTIAADEPLAVTDAAEEWADDPAYERWELACYVGTNVEVDGDLYGTLCFADTERPCEFTAADRTFVELLATWVQYELERQRREQRLERENERLAEFANVVSHDLRNPLSLAKGHVELLEERDTDPEVVAAVADALDRMSQLIEDVLALAREGRVVDDPKPTSVPAVATDAWRLVDADGDLDADPDAPVVYADPERLQTLFENLFRNAHEHGNATRVHVGVDDDVLFVGDDGTGIPADDHESVFEHGYTTAEDGTGFGLAIVAEVADAHGWQVSLAESETGGARFEFRGVESVED
jgi:PAS domain S-box-containing protein